MAKTSVVYTFDVLGGKNVTQGNYSENINYISAAVSDAKKKMYFTEMPNFLGGASYLSAEIQKENSFEIQTICIDDWCCENSIENVDFIKTDLEGSDLAALKG